jgi:hypothetical protein
MPKESPCRYCVPPKRTPTCHSTCPEFKKWRAELDEENAKIREIKEAEKRHTDYCVQGVLKWKKRTKK